MGENGTAQIQKEIHLSNSKLAADLTRIHSYLRVRLKGIIRLLCSISEVERIQQNDQDFSKGAPQTRTEVCWFRLDALLPSGCLKFFQTNGKQVTRLRRQSGSASDGIGGARLGAALAGYFGNLILRFLRIRDPEPNETIGAAGDWNSIVSLE